MPWSECLFLSIALAMDCFSIAVVAGVIEKRFHPLQAFSMAILFGLFQALMPLVGWAFTGMFYRYIESVAPLIAFAMLLFIGGRMIWESLRSEENVSFNPCRILTLLYLAVATSIDALAIGVSFSCVGMNRFADIARPLAVIAAGSFLFTLLGKIVGVFVGRRFHFNAVLLGGVILVLLGIKTLISFLQN